MLPKEGSVTVLPASNQQFPAPSHLVSAYLVRKHGIPVSATFPFVDYPSFDHSYLAISYQG